MKEQKEEQVEEQGKAIPTKMDASSVTKKRDTSFVDERKKQIELYGSYYPAGLSDEMLLDWIGIEASKLGIFSENLLTLSENTRAKIEYDRQERIDSLLNGMCEADLEQLKSRIK